MEDERTIRKRIEEYGERLIRAKEYRKKNGSPYNILFPSDETDTPKFWDNEMEIDRLKTRIDELYLVLEDPTPRPSTSDSPKKKKS